MFKVLSDGNISISCMRGDGDEYINVTIDDKDTRIRLMQIQIDLKEFAEALTGRGQVDCKYGTPGFITEAIKQVVAKEN